MLSPEKMVRIAALTQLQTQRPLTPAEQAEREQLLVAYHKSVPRDFHQAMEDIRIPPGDDSKH